MNGRFPRVMSQRRSEQVRYPFQRVVIPCDLKSIWCDIHPPGFTHWYSARYVVGRSTTCSSTDWEMTRSTEPDSMTRGSNHGALYSAVMDARGMGTVTARRIASMRSGR